MLIDLWNIFHDGSLVSAEGEVPGDLRLRVGIEYLREGFPANGDAFIVTLINCQLFEYADYDSETRVQNLATISKKCLGILSAKELASTCRVFTETGTLDIVADSALIHLDSGKPISFEELRTAADEYWKNFGSSPD